MKLTTLIASLLLTANAAMLLAQAGETPSSDFAQALKQMSEPRPMSYTELMTVNGKEPIKIKHFVAADGRSRTEMVGSGLTTIFDANSNMRITLLEAGKQAIVPDRAILETFERLGIKGTHRPPWLTALALSAEFDKELGQKELDGKRVTGFVATRADMAFTIWIDAETRKPVNIELDSPVNGADRRHIAMTDFRFDETFDESLFSFSVPEGYTVFQRGEKAQPAGEANAKARRPAKKPKTSNAVVATAQKPAARLDASVETNVIEALRTWTERDSGKFPPSIADRSSWVQLLDKERGSATFLEDKRRLLARLPAITAFLSSMSNGDYDYLGEGKTADQKDAIVFWYKKPDGTYRAVHGDLTARDITSQDLLKQVTAEN